ncbi:MAG: hypothetical protein ACOVP1_04730 [Bacteroidia bacterium]
MLKKVLPFICFISSVFLSTAQEKKVLWHLGISPVYGKVWAHTDSLDYLGGTNFKGIQVDFIRTRTDAKAYEYAKNHYSSGFSLQYFYFKAPQLGTTFNLLYFIEPNLIYKPTFQLKLRAGGGFNYASNPWNANNNPRNYAYSWHTSGCLVLGLNAGITINRFSKLTAHVLYNHFSNGNTRNPNLGLNYPQMGIGYEVLINQRTAPIQSNQNTYRKYYAEVYGLMSNKSHPDTKTTRYPVYGMGISLGRRISNLHAFSLGAEVISDKSLRYAMDSHPKYKTGNYSDVLAGVSLGHDFVFHRMRVTQQVGYYVFKEAPDFFIGSIYQRYGVDFTFSRKFTLGLNLNASLQKAFVFDVRAGWRFWGNNAPR